MGTKKILLFEIYWNSLFQCRYLPVSRQLKRLEGGCRSPMYSYFAETSDGLTTIRAFDHRQRFFTNMCALMDRFMRVKYANIIAGRWLGLRLELIGAIVVLLTALFSVLSNQYEFIANATLVGLSLSYALNVCFID